MKTDDFEIYEDCGFYRVVCTDYDRDEYLPSVIINRTGALILKGLKAGRSVHDIALELSGEEVSQKEAAEDAYAFLRAMAAKGYRIEEDIYR